MADKDFVIKNSTLVEYVGTDGIVIIPDGIECIGEYAFSDNGDITHVTIPVGVTTIEEYAFSDCVNLETIIFPDSIQLIKEGAFQSCVSLESVAIPEGVVSIGACAFASCVCLNDVEIPDTVMSIGRGAFLRCESLENIALPKKITRIEDFTFKECCRLENVDIPDGVTFIGMNAFQFCECLDFVFVPSSVKSIRLGAFSGCDALQMVVISSGTIDVSRGAFSTESNVCVHGPANSYIEKYATKQGFPFVKWDNEFQIEDGILKQYEGYSGYVAVPEGVTAIEDFAFASAFDLILIEIPESVAFIGEDAFCSADNYTITAPRGSFAEKYAYEHTISFVPLEYNVCTEEGWLVTYEDQRIVVQIPEGTKTITYTDTSGFSGPAIVEIPNSVTDIDDLAFAYCEELIICAPLDSIAEKYAKENNYQFSAK
jgi:hypothetical protein